MDEVESVNGIWMCQKHINRMSKGVFFGDSPFKFNTPILLMQLSISSLLTTVLQLFLTPIGESAFFSQMLVGIALGPSILGKISPVSERIYPRQSHYTNETLATLGPMLYIFLVGVKMDLSMVKKSGKKSVAIAICSFVLSLILNTLTAKALKMGVRIENDLKASLNFIIAFHSLSSYHVIACLLADLKLLNSELGRLATSSSMISGTLTWIWVIVTFSIKQSSESKENTTTRLILSSLTMLVVIICILRPIMKWMVRQTKEGKYVKENYTFSIIMMILLCALFGEVVGHHFLLGPMLLGVAVPSGPPLGSELVKKLETFVSGIILPAYFLYIGAKINLSSVQIRTVVILQLLAFSSFIGKVLGTMLPSLYYKMPAVDAFSLGLVMSAQGITDVLFLRHAEDLHLINQQSYSIIVVSMVVMTGIITPIIKILYNPSKQFRSYKRRTIQHMMSDTELHLLACIYHHDNTHPVINILEVSNPTARNPICLYVVHLLELTGRASPLLMYHDPRKKNSFYRHYSDRIINAFRLYEQNNNDCIMVKAFTTFSPYATMHHEICTLALDKKVSMVIVPFHKQWRPIGMEEELVTKHVRDINRNILQNAPCSVGIFVDRGTLTASSSMSSRNLQNIGMIFIAGPDDREALAYAMRMADHPNVNVTVVRLVEPGRKRKGILHFELDDSIVNEFRIANLGKKFHAYREEVVSDGVKMIELIRSLENNYDLILVGRHHDKESQLFIGLEEWNEFPELGIVGDMLANPDSSCHVSVLVVQQQILVTEEVPYSVKRFKENSATVNIFRPSGKVWPV